MNDIEIWYLDNLNQFENRKLQIEKSLGKMKVELVEIRKSDKKVFKNIIPRKKIRKILEQESKRVQYKIYLNDNITVNGWVYGTNKEIKNKKGEIIQIRQYSTDFHGRKMIVKKVIK